MREKTARAARMAPMRKTPMATPATAPDPSLPEVGLEVAELEVDGVEELPEVAVRKVAELVVRVATPIVEVGESELNPEVVTGTLVVLDSDSLVKTLVDDN
jgi:hypothetical protein